MERRQSRRPETWKRLSNGAVQSLHFSRAGRGRSDPACLPVERTVHGEGFMVATKHRVKSAPPGTPSAFRHALLGPFQNGPFFGGEAVDTVGGDLVEDGIHLARNEIGRGR
jgi:hypothetical protein